MKIAVLDLGTNVFNLLIVEISNSQYKFIKEFKAPSRLAAGGGLSDNFLYPEAFDNARRAISHIMSEINNSVDVDNIYAFATSAVRDAKNGASFVKMIKDNFGFEVKVIDGDKEAELIFHGVMGSLDDKIANGEISKESTFLTMDIGGGSVEFIISSHSEIYWKRSFPLGMARMREMFNYIEPIDTDTIDKFNNYCFELLEELWEKVKFYSPKVFVGSSGSFETFKDLIYNCGFSELPSIELKREDLEKLNNYLIGSTTQERLCLKGMSEIRVDFIVLASVFTQMVLSNVNPEVVYQSAYSLKEGAAKVLIENLEQ